MKKILTILFLLLNICVGTGMCAAKCSFLDLQNDTYPIITNYINKMVENAEKIAKINAEKADEEARKKKEELKDEFLLQPLPASSPPLLLVSLEELQTTTLYPPLSQTEEEKNEEEAQ
jgi:hypothetical protein